MAEHKLSLPAAILVNINIMIGSGLFVNTVLLAQNVHAYGAIVYALIGIILLPLVFTFAQLLSMHEGGTFYDFGTMLHPTVGFIAGFSYFIAKLAACTLGIHVFVTFILQAFPILNFAPKLAFDFFIIFLFVLLNMFNIKTGRSIQYGFLLLKLTPILFVILCGLFLFQGQNIDLTRFSFSAITGSIPFVLYAFTGFEACCSLSRNIENSQKNAPKVILISFLIGVLIVVLYQLMFYGAFGPALEKLNGYAEAFPAFIKMVIPTATILQKLFFIALPIGIAASSLGAAYGVLYSNLWNLYRLANTDNLPFSSHLKSLNKNHVPYFAVIVEGLIVVAYLFLTLGNQVPLQQVNSFGMTITYTISTLALLIFGIKHHKKWVYIPILALTTCCLLFFGFLRNITIYSPIPFLIFSAIIIICTILFFIKYKSKQ